MKRLVGTVVFILVFVFSNSVLSVDIKVGSTLIHLPSLAGYVEISQDFPEIRKTAESLTPSENRLLAVFLSDADVAKALQGEIIGFDKYVLIQTFREGESQRLSKASFGEIKPILKQNLGLNKDALADTNKRLVESFTEISERRQIDLLAEVEKPILFSIDTNTETAIGGTSISRQVGTINGSESSHVLIWNQTNILIKGKILFIYMYANYEGKNSIDSLRWNAVDWIRNIEIENPTPKSLQEKFGATLQSNMWMDLLFASILCLLVSLLPAYLIRHKFLKRKMSKGVAVIYLIGTYFVIWFTIAAHTHLNHPELQTRPGYLFLYLVLWGVWKVVRGESVH